MKNDFVKITTQITPEDYAYVKENRLKISQILRGAIAQRKDETHAMARVQTLEAQTQAFKRKMDLFTTFLERKKSLREFQEWVGI